MMMNTLPHFGGVKGWDCGEVPSCGFTCAEDDNERSLLGTLEGFVSSVPSSSPPPWALVSRGTDLVPLFSLLALLLEALIVVLETTRLGDVVGLSRGDRSEPPLSCGLRGDAKGESASKRNWRGDAEAEESALSRPWKTGTRGGSQGPTHVSPVTSGCNLACSGVQRSDGSSRKRPERRSAMQAREFSDKSEEVG